ncbi:MAG: monovalent cation/H+ antiporter subunit D family protein [Opitutae bacterium]|nr:monovalent cation/H+ antiporter subunit D family protein [Opitutae bacterium]
MTPPAIISITPVLASLVSLLAVIPIILLGGRANLREGASFVAGIVKFGLIASMLPTIMAGSTIEYTLWEIVPNLAIAFRVDALGMIFGLVASSLWIITTLYSIGYMRGLKEHAQTRFFSYFSVSLAATIGVAFSANLFTLFLFYEMLSLATYPLVTHHQDKEARSGGRTYLTYLLTASILFVLPSLIYIFIKTGGGLDFVAGGFLEGHVGGTEALVLLILLTFGFAKAGIMPLHSWLPAAMVAPTPVSALLHAVAVVKVGVFCILRVYSGVFGIEFLSDLNLGTIVTWIAAFTVVVSSLIALTQDNLKRRLAFSTIGQLSYIVLGMALLTPKGVTGSMMHIAMHAWGKITLFFCAGAIFQATGKKYISEMVGIGKRMPVTMAAFFIGSLSVIGIPLAGGFWSKLYLLWGTVEDGRFTMLVVLLTSSLLNAAYFFPIAFRAFFCKPEDSRFEAKVEEAHPCAVVALSLTAVVTMLLFIYPEPFFALADTATQHLMNR